MFMSEERKKDDFKDFIDFVVFLARFCLKNV